MNFCLLVRYEDAIPWRPLLVLEITHQPQLVQVSLATQNRSTVPETPDNVTDVRILDKKTTILINREVVHILRDNLARKG